jgi:AcrR family transcriptional regulator
VFAVDGLDASMREIARRAGVGPATLYRRFPTKETLVTAAFMSTYPNAIDFAAGRERALGSLAELARGAKDAGHLRPDFVLDDLILILMANNGIHAASPAARVAASRRFAALAIQGLRAFPAAAGHDGGGAATSGSALTRRIRQQK